MQLIAAIDENVSTTDSPQWFPGFRCLLVCSQNTNAFVCVVNGMRTNFVTSMGCICHNNLLSLKTIFKIVLDVVILMTAMFCFSF